MVIEECLAVYNIILVVRCPGDVVRRGQWPEGSLLDHKHRELVSIYVRTRESNNERSQALIGLRRHDPRQHNPKKHAKTNSYSNSKLSNLLFDGSNFISCVFQPIGHIILRFEFFI